MTNSIAINNQNVIVKQYNGQRVVTFKDIDLVHGRTGGTAKRNFGINREHFIEGEDYFKICQDEIRSNKIQGISNKCHRDIVFVTESGYLMLVKSFTDDLSWKVQRQLVNTYFRGKDEQSKSESYEYFDKTYNGEPVLSTGDIEHLTKIKRGTIDWYLRTKLVENTDYYYIEGDSLKKYKTENPKVSKLMSSAYIVKRDGFIKLCRAYGIMVETPKCFEEKSDAEQLFSINKLIERLNKKYGYDISVRDLTQELAEIYTDGKIKNQSVTIKHDNKYYICVDRSAPLLNRRFLAAQGIGCILSGQLRSEHENGTTLISNYSEASLNFASSLMAMSVFFDK